MHELTDQQRAFLAAQHHREAFSDLSPAEINRMTLAEYARRTGRVTPGETAATVYDFGPGMPQTPPESPQSVSQPSAPVRPGIDVASLSAQEYAAVRGQLGMGLSRQEGIGLLNQPGSQSWAEAARAKSGRTGWNGSNVVESPRLNRPFLKPEVHLDTRSADERFYTPGNSFGAS